MKKFEQALAGAAMIGLATTGGAGAVERSTRPAERTDTPPIVIDVSTCKGVRAESQRMAEAHAALCERNSITGGSYYGRRRNITVYMDGKPYNACDGQELYMADLRKKEQSLCRK